MVNLVSFEQIVAGARLLVEAYERGIELSVQGGHLLYRPKHAVTEEFRGRLRDIKPVLLSILSTTDTDKTPEMHMPAGVLSKRAPDDAKIDAEFDRFFAVAVPTPDGLGLYDPTYGGPEMPTGVLGEDWRRFEDDCRHLRKRSET